MKLFYVCFPVYIRQYQAAFLFSCIPNWSEYSRVTIYECISSRCLDTTEVHCCKEWPLNMKAAPEGGSAEEMYCNHF